MKRSRSVPVYNIEQFSYQANDGDVYASVFSTHLRDNADLVWKRHAHRFYLSVYFTRGSGVHEIDFVPYEVAPGMVFTLAPGQIHTWKFSPGIEGFIFFHTKEFYNLFFLRDRVEEYPFYSTSHPNPLIVLPASLKGKFTNCYAYLVTEYEGGGLMKYQMMCSLIHMIYVELARLYVGEEVPKSTLRRIERARQLDRYIEAGFREHKDAGHYAARMHMSVRSLNRLSVDVSGTTVKEAIRRRVVLEASRLLIGGNMSVTEIGLELGFADTANFSRMFRKETGFTPSRFAKERSGPL